MDDITKTLKNPAYCNWLDVRLLKRIANLAEISEAKKLIETYEECLYSKKVLDVTPYFKQIYFNPKHVTLVETKISKNVDNMVVLDVINYCRQLESDMNISPGSVTATDCARGCLTIKCIVPLRCLLHMRWMAKKIFFKFRQYHIHYLQIGGFPKVFAWNVHASKASLSMFTSTAPKCKDL